MTGLRESYETSMQDSSTSKSSLKAVFPKCETSDGLCGKAKGFKFMCSINYNNYLEGIRCFANELKGTMSRHCIFMCSR